MSLHYFQKFWLLALVFTLVTVSGSGQTVFAFKDQSEEDEGGQVLTRGPVHEAFAETVTFDPQPGIQVSATPPEPIEELPPEQKPEGDNIVWITGYWGWDDERNDFLWVSGVWRAVPPGRQWVPGYWASSGGGYQWTSGYWANSELSDIEYLPEPPETVEVGPNIEAPSPEHSWIPGCWIWHHGRYAWRPGYWVEMKPEWNWVPAHHVWTPRGYVFVGGYWDYPVSLRGILFAPVYFTPRVYMRHGFHFSPAFVINLNVFSDCLFWRRHYNHYYFGDYYAAHYYNRAFFPWFSLHTRRYGYDPIYAHQRWMHRHDRNWEHRLHKEFRKRRDHEDARPMRRLSVTGQMPAEAGKKASKRVGVVLPFDRVVKNRDTSWQFQSLNTKERMQMRHHGKDLGNFREVRKRMESKPVNESSGKKLKQTREKLPRSPIMSIPKKKLRNQVAPPKRYTTPKPNPDVEPTRRYNDNSFESNEKRKSNTGQWRKPGHDAKSMRERKDSSRK